MLYILMHHSYDIDLWTGFHSQLPLQKQILPEKDAFILLGNAKVKEIKPINLHLPEA